MTIFSCDLCKFSTKIAYNFGIHNATKKHLEITKNNSSYKFSCDICNKKYLAKSGLWSHKKKCNAHQLTLLNMDASQQDTNKKLEEIKNIVIQLSEKPAQIITNNSNNNQNNQLIENQNNQFNINLFLNENVKPSISFIELISSLKIDKSYKDNMERHGYLENLVNVFKDAIKEIPIFQRPIHCIKNEIEHQEVLHIHDNNQWKREIEIDWSSQIYNYYRGDQDLEDDEKNRIFHGVVKMEETILEQVKELFTTTVQAKMFEKDNESEMYHVPNKINFIKSILEYIKLDKDEFKKVMDEVL